MITGKGIRYAFFLMIFQTYHKITANSFGSFMIIEYFCSN